MPSRKRLFGWWYLSIAVGYVLLAVSHAIDGGPWWGTGLRLVISAGFGLLAADQLRTTRRKG